MNLKKFISGVSALTIAASAFAGMAVTASAATNTLYERGTSSTAWSDADLSAWTLSGNAAANPTINADHGLYAECNQTGAVTKSLTVTDNAIVTYEVDFYTENSPGRDTNYAYVKFGSAVSVGYNSTYKLFYSTNGGSTYSSAVTESVKGKTTNIKAVIDTSTNTLKSLTIAGAEVAIAANTTLDASSTYDSISMGFVRAGSVSWDTLYGLKTVKITEETQEVTTADYTINYVLGDKTVYSASGTGVVGQTITAATVVTDEEGQRYYITDTTAPTFEVAANNNVWTVNVRAAENYTVKVVPSTDASKVIATGTVVEGDSYTYTYPMYLTDEDNKVLAKANATTYGATVTPTSNNQVFTVDYTAYTGTAYFVEAEAAITGTSHDGLSSWNLSSADAVRGFAGSAKTVMTVPEDGVYKVTYAALTTNSGAGKGGDVTLYKNSTEEANVINTVNVDSITINSVQTAGTVSKEDVELRAGDTLVVLTSMSTGSLDYVLIEKTADLPEENTVEADAVGESYTDEATKTVYTPFTATVSTTPTAVKVTGEDGVEYDGEITNVPNLSGDALVGIIVSGAQKAIKVVFTVE